MEINENNETERVIGENGSTDGWAMFNSSRLSAANDEIARTLLPVMLFLASLGLIGLIGNSLVCYIFARKFSRGSQNFLVICLAVFDLHTCLLTLPYEIIDLRFYAFYVFDSDYICKVFKFVNVFCNLGSILTLVIIAVDRYRKVCKPFTRQLRLGQIQLIFVSVLLVSIGYSTPCFFLYGYRTFNSSLVNGTLSRECSTPDGVSTLYPTIYNGFLLLNFIVITTALTCMYHGILKEVKRRNRRRRTLSNATSQKDTTACSINTDDGNSSTAIEEKKTKSILSDNLNNSLIIGQTKDDLQLNSFDKNVLPDLVVDKVQACQKLNAFHGQCTHDVTAVCKDNPSSQTNAKQSRSLTDTEVFGLFPVRVSTEKSNYVRRNSSDPLAGKRVNPKRTISISETFISESADITLGEASSAGLDKKRSRPSRKRRRAKNQTTMVAFSVTIVFIISYLPHLTLMISKLVIFVGFDETVENEGFILYNLFLRTYFINSMCNPIIYGILNSRFRLEIRRLFRSNCC
ncbi:octopamine receptor [Biomphalaria glabrata]|nr:octopamine receptor [Biomphalaria glabrata]